MARDNPSNPFTNDPAHTQRDVPLPIQKAKVIDAAGMPNGNGFHTVKIRVYGDNSPHIAPVLTPLFGSVWVPEPGTDVAVMWGSGDKPWVIGAWYPLDRVEDEQVDLPDYEVGDLRLGNASGSHVTVHNDGHITIETGERQAIDIDNQSATVYLGTDQSVPGDSAYHTIEFDTIESDVEDLFDTTTHTYTLHHGGRYDVSTTIEIPLPAQNNRYTLGIFVNGSLAKRKSRQSVVNEPLSLDCQLSKRLDEGDEIDVRLLNESGSDKTVNGSQITNNFDLERKGI